MSSEESKTKPVDMRSDTVTKPTEAMREAMRDAPVGDDVYGDDPTVAKLQAMGREVSGKEASLFVSSGTMGNLLAIMVHCRERGAEFICGDNAHIFIYEGGGSASLAGVHPRPLITQADGTLKLEDIRGAIRHDDPHYPRTAMIALENTHNRKGGRVLKPEYVDSVAEIARGHGLKLHMDGARLFNAATALGVPIARIVENCDSVTFCLSKALGAPAGSLLCGTKDFIYHAHRFRKALGGGMRQIGVLAAPGILALRDMPAKLPEDHARAKTYAKAIAGVAGVTCNVDAVESNLVLFSVGGTGIDAGVFVETMKREHAVWMGAKDDKWIRAAFHHQVTDDDVTRAIAAVTAVAAGAAE